MGDVLRSARRSGAVAALAVALALPGAAIGAEVVKPEQAAQGVQQEGAMLRAVEGQRPAGAVAEMMTTTVEIDSVDTRVCGFMMLDWAVVVRRSRPCGS